MHIIINNYLNASKEKKHEWGVWDFPFENWVQIKVRGAKYIKWRNFSFGESRFQKTIQHGLHHRLATICILFTGWEVNKGDSRDLLWRSLLLLHLKRVLHAWNWMQFHALSRKLGKGRRFTWSQEVNNFKQFSRVIDVLSFEKDKIIYLLITITFNLL